MKYYTYGYEDWNGNKGTVTVKANTKEEAWEKLSTYHVSCGELHYAWYLSESETGKEQFYRNKKSEQSIALLISAFGVALGHEQVSQYGDHGTQREWIKKEFPIKKHSILLRT